MNSRIMYLEDKSASLNGEAWIGRVTFSRSARTIHYGDRQFERVRWGYKSNAIEFGTGREFWISGCKKRGGDRLNGSGLPVRIDEDVREEYWTTIRGEPDRSHEGKA